MLDPYNLHSAISRFGRYCCPLSHLCEIYRSRDLADCCFVALMFFLLRGSSSL